MKSVEKIEKGQKLNFARKGLNGPEIKEVKFLRPIPSDPNRCWCELQGKDFRVSVSKLSVLGEDVPAHVKYGQAEPEQEGDSTKPDNAQETIENLTSKKKVETIVKKKTSKKVEKKEVKKPVVDSKKEAKVSKREMITKVYVSNRDLTPQEISEKTGASIGTVKYNLPFINMKLEGKSNKEILKKYSWCTEKKLNVIEKAISQCQK